MNYNDVTEDIDGQMRQLDEVRRVLVGLNTGRSGKARRMMSAAGRRRIAAAQRARWAKIRAAKK